MSKMSVVIIDPQDITITPLALLNKLSDPLQVVVETPDVTYCLCGGRITAQMYAGEVYLDKESWANQSWTRRGRNKFLQMYGIISGYNLDRTVTSMIKEGDIKLIDLN